MELQKQSKLYDLETLIKKADIFYGSGGSQNAIFVYKNSVGKLIPNFKKGFKYCVPKNFISRKAEPKTLSSFLALIGSSLVLLLDVKKEVSKLSLQNHSHILTVLNSGSIWVPRRATRPLICT